MVYSVLFLPILTGASQSSWELMVADGNLNIFYKQDI